MQVGLPQGAIAAETRKALCGTATATINKALWGATAAETRNAMGGDAAATNHNVLQVNWCSDACHCMHIQPHILLFVCLQLDMLHQ